MPAYAKQLSDQEIADVTTYIRNSWGNAAPAVTAEQVAKARKPSSLTGILRFLPEAERPARRIACSGTRVSSGGCPPRSMEEHIHGHQPNPNDPYRRQPPLTIPIFRISPMTRIPGVSLDNELQPDPELAEGPASGGKIAMFAVAIAVVLGAVFYGLNNSSGQPGRHLADRADHADAAATPAAPPGSGTSRRRPIAIGYDDRCSAGRRRRPPARARQPTRRANSRRRQASGAADRFAAALFLRPGARSTTRFQNRSGSSLF